MGRSFLHEVNGWFNMDDKFEAFLSEGESRKLFVYALEKSCC